MASMFARSSRSKDEDDLRKDHRKRKIGHQIDEDVEDFEAGKYHPPTKLSDLTIERRHDETMRALKTRPGANIKKKEDIFLPDPLKGKHVASIDVGDYVDPKTKEKSRITRGIFGGDPDDPRREERHQKEGYPTKPTAKRKRRTQ